MNNADLIAYANRRLAQNPPVVATVGETDYVLDTEDAECSHDHVDYSNDAHTWITCEGCGEEWTAEEYYGDEAEDSDAHWYSMKEGF